MYVFEHEQTAHDLLMVFNFCGRRLLYAYSYLFNITTDCIYVLLVVKTTSR